MRRLRFAVPHVRVRCASSATASSSCPPRPCLCYEPGGLVPYEDAWNWQQRLRRERMDRVRPRGGGGDGEGDAGGGTTTDALLLLQHRAVYTLGRGSAESNLKFAPDDPSVELHRVERGGEVTYHGPGQLVGYPVLDLRHHKQDLRWYVRRVEDVVIRVLGHYGLRGERDVEHTGVWVGGEKVAAIGIAVSRWITMHGFAINVCPNMADFDRIVPCGIADRGVTSLERLLPAGAVPSVDDVRARARDAVADVFGLRIVRVAGGTGAGRDAQ